MQVVQSVAVRGVAPRRAPRLVRRGRSLPRVDEGDGVVFRRQMDAVVLFVVVVSLCVLVWAKRS